MNYDEWQHGFDAPKRRIKRNAVKCLNCGDVIESKHRHDFVSCSCHKTFVDGGLDYVRVGGNPDQIEFLTEWEDNDTKEEN